MVQFKCVEIERVIVLCVLLAKPVTVSQPVVILSVACFTALSR